MQSEIQPNRSRGKQIERGETEKIPPEFQLTEKVIRPWLDWQRREQGVPGIAFSVIYKGKVAFSGGVGYADRATKAPMTETIPFGIASISKSFTAVVIGQLVREGRLALDTRVTDVLPRFQSRNVPDLSDVTVEHLLTHTSGIRKDADTIHGPDAEYPTGEQLLRLVDTPHFQSWYPGEDYAYSNVAYAFAGQVIEAVTGKPYAVNLQERIFDPLGMIDTYVDRSEPNPAVGHEREVFGGNRVNYPKSNTMAPAFGIFSTAADISKYITALMEQENGSLPSLGVTGAWLAERDDFLDEFIEIPYGRGLERYGDNIGHSGNIEGFSSHMQLRSLHESGLRKYDIHTDCRHKDTGIILLANVMSAPVQEFAQQIFRTLDFFRDRSATYARNMAEYFGQEIRDISKYTGIYRARWADMNMVDLNGRLVSFLLQRYNLDPLLGRKMYIPTVKPDVFTSFDPRRSEHSFEPLKFEEDSRGNVLGFLTGTNDSGSYFQKVEVD